MEMDSQYVSLEDLQEKNGLSVRAYNVCRYSNLLNLNDILYYYQEYGCFIRLRNCGRKTDTELVLLCMNYVKRQKMQGSVIELVPIKSISKRMYDISSEDIQQLSPLKVEMIEYFIWYRYKVIMGPYSTVLLAHLKGDLSINSIWLNIFQVDFNPAYIKGIGENNVTKINVLVHEIYLFIREVMQEDDEVRLFDQLLAIKRRFSNNKLENVASLHIRKYIGMKPDIALFKLMEDLIAEQLIFPLREVDVLTQQVGCFVDFCEETLDSIGKRYGHTRERIRQIRKDVYLKMYRLFSLVKSIPSISAARYGIDGSAGYIPISDELVQQVNLLDGTRFSAQVIGKVFESVLADSYALLGCSMDLFFEKKNKLRYQWLQPYLVAKKYTLAFDFTRLLDDLCAIFRLKRQEPYLFNLKKYVFEYQPQGDTLLLNEIVLVAKQLVWHEMNLITNDDDDIVFEPNSSRLLSDYIYDLLLEVNRPTALSWIEREIKQRYPEVKVGVSSFYVTCRNDSRFILWVTGAIYGLREWKDEANIKGGRILNLVEEYLQAFDEPKHLDSITTYIRQFRNTNRDSIISNIYQDRTGRFRILGKSMIGLTAKEYPSLKHDYALSEQ